MYLAPVTEASYRILLEKPERHGELLKVIESYYSPYEFYNLESRQQLLLASVGSTSFGGSLDPFIVARYVVDNIATPPLKILFSSKSLRQGLDHYATFFNKTLYGFANLSVNESTSGKAVISSAWVRDEAVNTAIVSVLILLEALRDRQVEIEMKLRVREPWFSDIEKHPGLGSVQIAKSNDQSKLSLEVSGDILDSHNSFENPAVLQHISELYSQNVYKKNTLANAVRLYLLKSKQMSKVKRENIAEMFHISTRQFTRRLEAEGTSFKTIQKEVVILQFRSQIYSGNSDLDTLAYDLGYSDRSSLDKFLISVTGLSLSMWSNLIRNPVLMDIQKEIHKLLLHVVPLSETLTQAFEMLKESDSDEFDIRKLASVLEGDSGASVMIMKAANSAYYGGKHKTVQGALINLGLYFVRNMIYSYIISRQINTDSLVKYTPSQIQLLPTQLGLLMDKLGTNRDSRWLASYLPLALLIMLQKSVVDKVEGDIESMSLVDIQDAMFEHEGLSIGVAVKIISVSFKLPVELARGISDGVNDLESEFDRDFLAHILQAAMYLLMGESNKLNEVLSLLHVNYGLNRLTHSDISDIQVASDIS